MSLDLLDGIQQIDAKDDDDDDQNEVIPSMRMRMKRGKENAPRARQGVNTLIHMRLSENGVTQPREKEQTHHAQLVRLL